MSLRDFIRQTKMLIEHGLYVTRGTANGGLYERPLEAARLEERILFSASAMAPVAAELAEAGEAVTSALALMGDNADESANSTLSDQQFLDLIADTILPQTVSQSPSDSNANGDDGALTEDPATNDESITDNSGIELVFVDTGIADYETIVDDIRANSRSTRSVQVVLLDATQDGLKQINLYMSGMTQTVDTVHLITHGTERAVKLGSTWIDAGSLSSHQSDFEQWRNVLSPNADLVFYGCDLAGGESGRSILESIALWTDADVAASDDSTGLQSLGGDWDLEYSIGEIDSAIIVSGELQREWHGLLATFTVTNTNNSGAGSLRQAIIDANNLAGTDTITFSIGSGVQTISLSTILPDITDTVIINGTTQSGYAGTPLIVITGNNSIQDGLRLYAGSDNSTIRGLVLQGFTQDAIDVTTSGNTIRGNYIGTNAAGTAAAGNNNGLNIWSGDNNIVGGTAAADRNIISGNTNVGMIISGGAHNTQVYGNYIGLNAAGTGALGNTYHGLLIDGSNGTILGGTTAGHRNVISGNGSLGLGLLDADNSVIYGNYFGTNAAGTADINGTTWNSSQTGIYIDSGSSGNQVGSTVAGARNIISGNNHYGVEILGATSNNNTVSGNYIGTDATGMNAVGNSGGGVSFWGAGTGNVYSNNVISGNLYVGVLVGNASTGATIQGNLIGLGADGSTVVGNSDAGIYVEGASTGTLIGTDLDGNGDVVEGNTIAGNSHGIIVSDAGTTGTEILGNRIGTNAAGTLDRGNANDGVLVQNGASNTSIGGSAAGAGNLISGNNEGIELTGSATTLNTIQGNLIGLNVNGTGTIGNDFDGIHVSAGAHHNTIGGTTAGAGNVVAGNGASGIQVEGSGSDFNTIQGNFIGTDITGLIGLGNGNSGIKLGNSAADNLIGGTTAGAGNVIAANVQNGIEINSSSSNTVQGNLIGVGTDGVTDLGNSMHGIDINSGSSNNLIGGDDPDAGNTIVNNTLDGVSVDSTGGTGNSILGNSITANGARGIDLTDEGVTLNDAGDADTGANALQNFPVLTAVYSSGGNTRIRGSLNSTSGTTFRIEFFASQFTDSRGYGEGQVFLGAISITTNGSGNATIDHLLTGVSVTPGYAVSATATVDLGSTYGDTSEFSLSFAAMGSPLLISAPLQSGQIRVNTTTGDDQELQYSNGVSSAVAMDEDGDTVVVWTSNLQDGSGSGIFAQRYDRDGAAVGSEFQINTTTSDSQYDAVVDMDATGGFVVAWASALQDGSGSGVYTRRYDSSGNATSGEARVNVTTSGNQRAPSIAMSEDGKYVVTWQSSDGSGDGIWARVYDSTGSAITSEFRVNSATASTQQNATSAMDADGDFVVVWADSNTNLIMGQRYNSSGVAQGSNFQVSEDGSVSVRWPSVAMSDTGEFVVAWKSDEQSGANTQMFFRRFDSSGNTLGGQVLIGTDSATFNNDTYPTVAMDDVGNFVISWDESDRDGSGQGVYARRYDSNGAMIGNEFRVNSTVSGSQYFPNVAMDDEGDFTVIFVGDQSGDKDVYMQRYLGAATTSESGNPASFHLVLDVAPSANVSVTATVSDVTESNSYTSGLTFTSGNWNTMQTAIIVGANDALFDGDISYDYILDAISSSDVLYSGVTPDSVSITNIDDEPPILYVDTTSDSTTGSDTSSIAALIANKGADGKISLREAILAANNTAGTDYIHFNITDPLVGGAHTITPASALPTITDTVILDATTDDDFAGTPVIVLDGNNLAASGLTLGSTAGGSTIQGLVIRDFGINGIEIQAGSDGNTIIGNYIGSLDVNGESAGAAEGNAGVGIKVLGANNIIGDIFAGLGNVIAGNTGDEIVITGSAAGGNMVQNNLIGTNADGTIVITSNGTGIYIENGATNNTIGGTATDAGNVIGGNNWAGIEVKGIGTSDNLIQGNWIGTDWTGTLDFGNNEQGVRTFDGATNNTIGGIDAGAGNVIAFNSTGVSIYSVDDTGNSILGNLIYSNSSIGIDLANDGVTVNDSDDSDTGANGLLNFPVLTSAAIVGSDTIITGSLHSTPGTTFLIEFYTSVAGDGTGHGEAETYLDAVTVTTDGSGNATISLTLSGWILTDGEIVTATATEDLGGGNFGSTSEFSGNVIVAGNDDPVLVDGGTASLSEGGTTTPFFGIGTVTDPDSPDFDGGQLLATITSGSQSGDVLILANIGGVTVSGTDVLVGGIAVGTVFGGAAGVPLTITFNSDATLARVQSVYQAVGLHSSVDNPVLGLRTISVTVDDGDGGTSNTATGNVDFNTAVNDLPVVTPSGSLAVAEDASGVMSLSVTDPDANGNSLKVSLSLSNSSGTISLGSTTGLTFSVGDGSLDMTMSFTGTLADLNNALASITYTPTSGFNGAETLLYTIDDQGNTGSGGAQEATGGISITVDSENDAPALTGANNLTAIDEDDVFNNGTLVSDLLVGHVTDPDPGAVFGVAVTAVNTSNGAWQYTVDGGSNWLSFGAVSASSARLLSADALTRVRFVPDSNYNGPVSNGITFSAWDGTTGVAGSTANITPITYRDQFNATSYSNNNGTGNWSGSWIETDNGGGGASGGFIRVNSGVLDVKSDRLNDEIYRQVDLSAANLAVLSFSYQNSIPGGEGDVVRLQISGNGGSSYSDLAVFSSGSHTGSGNLSFDITSYASINTRIRVIVTAVDQTRSVEFDNFQISSSTLTGGITAFSTATASSNLVVNAVNDEQVFVPGPGQDFSEGSGSNVVTTDTLLTTDADNSDPELIYTLSILPTHGVLKLNGVTLGVSGTFTQAQVNAGQLTYDHDGSEGDTDSLSFSVDDGLGADTGVLVNFQISGVNDNTPVIISNGAGAMAGVSVSENSTSVTTVHATDADLPAESITYSIVNNVDSLDAAKFSIDSVTGVLTFIAAPDFEAPTDSDGNNTYVVRVQATDGTTTDTQLITITVTDVISVFEVTTVTDIDDSGLGSSYTIEQLHAAGGGADGKISLREAIIAANTTAGLDTITFNISGAGPHTISLAAALPEITQAVIIDGWSEPDFAGTPIIQLDGTATGIGADGLSISGGGSTVRGLIFSGFDDRGISITGGGGNTIVGNWVGTENDGTTAKGNQIGIFISSANNIIGGTTAQERNVISGNAGSNIVISGLAAQNNAVIGNYIGTTLDGASAIASLGNGILISNSATGNLIGGSSAAAGNVIAGFGNIGIELTFGSDGNTIQGNLLGINATASAVIASGACGIALNGVSNTQIGGSSVGQGNTFGGFTNMAIWILGGGSNIDIQGNFFGTDATQTASYANGTAIDIWNATSTTIGGTAAGAGNVFANGTDSAIKVLSPSTGVSILGNSISLNTGLGIDLGGDGVTSNDSDDSDSGANDLTNFPVITMAARSGATVRVEGTLAAAASTQYRIEVFANAAAVVHSSGYGAGQRYLGFVTVTTDAAGNATFSTDITAAVAVGEYVSATATDVSGSTSEFSANRIIVAPIPVIDLDADDSGGETGADFIASYVEDGSPVKVADADAIAFDTDTSSLNKMTVTITNLIDGAHEILTVDTSGTTLNASYVGGVLTITGTANESDYQQVLRTITYHNTSQNADNTTRVLTITVEDSVFVSNTATSRIQVLTSNDAPTIQNNVLTISEGGIVVLTSSDLFSTDAEQSAAQLTYTVSGVSGGRFEFVANAGIAVTQFTQADISSGAVQFVHDGHEALPTYDVTVSDGNLTNGPQSVVVTFTNVNDAPVMNSDTFSVAENATLGTTVGFASSTDSDIGDTRNYNIVSGNTNGAFGVNAGSGEIVVLNPAALDYEVLTSFSLTIEVADSNGASSTAVVTINVTNVSDNSISAISDIDAASETIAENSGNGTVVGISALATDADAPDTISYTLTDDAGGRFAIDGVTGVVTVANGSALDYELGTSHNITVRADSTDGSFSNRTFQIQLTNVNEAGISAISDVNASANSVAENSSNGTTVGYTAFASDPDSTDSISYTLDDNAGGRFAIDSVTGIITVANGLALDRETAAAHTIIVRATSTDGSMAVLSVDISLIDVNEFAISTLSDLDAAANTVAELSLQGTLTGITVYASDADATTNTITYALDDDAGGRFQIDAVTGVITVGTTAIDYETASSYTVTARATSADGGTRPLVITINITDVNESGISVVTDNNATVNIVQENAATGTLTGISASATDPDGTDSVNYSLDNNAGGRFQIDSVTGVVTVANGTLLDRETAASHTILIRATSTDSSFSTQTFIVNLGDVDEFDVSPVTDSNLSIDGVNENSVNGATVGITANAFDSDVSSNTITWSLDDNAGGRFAINSASGIVTVANGTLLDAETATSHTIIVRATSADSSFSTRNFVIAVNDLNEFGISTVTDSDAALNAVDENAATGTVVGITASATDGDSGTNGITYVLTNNAGGRFAVDSTTGVVTVADGTLLNRETLASHNITVRAISADGTFSTQTFSVAVNDVNEFNVTGIADSNVAANALNENSANGTVVGITAAASDADATTNVILYSLDDTAGGRFQIDTITGIVTVADGTLLDFESSASHTIIVRATSADSSSSTQTFIISLLDVNDAPPVINPGQQLSVSELTSNGTVFGTVAAVDPDGVGTLQNWTIVSGNTDGIFAINPATGALRISNTALLNFETTSTYTLTLSVGDGSATSFPQTVLVRVMDGNEAPIFGVPTPMSIDENSANGTIVGSVSASDVDAGDLQSYTIIGSTPVSPFAIDTASGIIRVTDSALLNFESQQSITLQIQVTDIGGLTSTTSIVISLNDVNETPTLINLAGGTVQENRGAGTFVGQLSAVDPDAGEVLNWTMVDDANGTFVVNSTTGRIGVAAGAVLNFEQTAAYDIAVEVTDSGGLTHLQSFTIRLLDVNDAPIAASDLIPGIQLTGIEVLSPGLLLNDFDEDGDTLQAVLSSTTANGVLLLRADGSLLYSPNGVFSGIDTFVYYVTDGVASSAPVTVTIDVAAAVGGSSSGASGDSGDSTTDSSGSDTTTDSTDSSSSGGDEITVVTTTQFLAPPAAQTARSESSTTPATPVTETATETGPAKLSGDNVAITGELIASVFVSDFFVNTRSERIRTASAELAQAAVFGGMILDNGFNSALVSLNFFSIDQLVQRINEPTISERQELAGKVAVGSAAVVTTSLSVGYVIWILRGGSLLTTFMSAMPAWQAFDPLPVLQSFHKAVEEDDDSLLSIATRKTVDGLKKLRKS